jgi:hypothetical protein
MSKTRIYCVRDNDGGDSFLVRATSSAQALRHVTSPRFAATVATQDQLVRLLGEDVEVEDATAEPQA